MAPRCAWRPATEMSPCARAFRRRCRRPRRHRQDLPPHPKHRRLPPRRNRPQQDQGVRKPQRRAVKHWRLHPLFQPRPSPLRYNVIGATATLLGGPAILAADMPAAGVVALARNLTDQTEKPTSRWAFHRNNAGDHLISHTLTRAVPSAQRGLTSVFGMGTGGTLAVNSPANCRRSRRDRSQLNRLEGFSCK